MSRERTYTWEDSQIFVDAASGRSGLEFLGKISSGELPAVPARVTTGVVAVEVVTIGRRTATAEARILDSRDRGVAHGVTTCMVFEY